MSSELRELTSDELDSISGGETKHININLGIARFNLNWNEYGTCFNWGFGLGSGYDGVVCS